MAPNRQVNKYCLNAYIPVTLKNKVDELRKNNEMGIKLKFKEVILTNVKNFIETHKEKIGPVKGYDVKAEDQKFIGPDTSKKFYDQVIEYIDKQPNLDLRKLIILSLLEYVKGVK